MLHLLPLKRLFTAVLVLIIVIVVTLTMMASSYDTAPLSFIWLLVKWTGPAVTALVFLLFASWRWCPRLQRFIFPYLGGRWRGCIIFSGPAGQETRDVTLHVHHTPFSIKLILESEESLSKTLAVQASKSNDVEDDDKLYYVYLNTRKEGGMKSHRSYRGIAILRVKTSNSLTMVGDYFTESHRYGSLKFDVVELNPWWMLWK